MQIIKSIILVLCGVVLGIALVYFFSDELREDVQAAAPPPPPLPPTICDCPPAEAPMAGRLMVNSTTMFIGGGAADRFAATCPAGAQLISGSCIADYPAYVFNVTLREHGFYTVPPREWNCSFRNNEPMPLRFRASAICLNPSPP